MNDDALKLAIEKTLRIKRKFKVTKTIEFKDKINFINIKQRKFRPNIIMKNKKCRGVDRNCSRFSREQGINEFDC